MTSNEIVTALRRCTSKMPEPYCTDCSFAGKGTSAGKDDCIGAAMDAAAASIEKLVDRCARYAEEIAVLQEREKTRGDAQKEGRVIVMPVRPVLTPEISSTLYIIEDGEICEDWLYEVEIGMSESGETTAIYFTLEGQMSFEQADIGKTVFCTHEEAKKALEAQKNAETERTDKSGAAASNGDTCRERRV